MVSSDHGSRVRKPPEERRAEILSVASHIALEAGLERITLRAVAERLGVRPGLISHYFPAAEDLVIAAFELAVSGERDELFEVDGAPFDRLAHLVRRIESESSDELARLWLNVRHLSRFTPALARAVELQEGLDRSALMSLVEAGIEDRSFSVHDPFAAVVRIFMAIDGMGAYVNDREPFSEPSFTRFVSDTVVRELGVDAQRLRAAVDMQP